MWSSFSAKDPDLGEYTLSVTMTLKEWRHLKDRVEGNLYVESRFKSAISDMITQAEKVYFPSLESLSPVEAVADE